MSRDLNDSLENLFDGDKAEGGARPMAEHAPADYAAKAQRVFEEGCPACRGTGKFRSYSGRVLGDCFKCKGAGKRAFKTSAEDRAKGRAQAEARRERDMDENAAAFAKLNPVAYGWIIEAAPTFDFAREMLELVRKYGELSPGRLAACERAAEKRKAAAVARAERAAGAPVADEAGVDRLKAAFDTAAAYIAEKGLKRKTPKITIGGITISPAKASSQNAGALYVKDGSIYLGKIAGGRFFSARECGPEDQAKVLKFVADPAQAAKVYGQETGTCCVCNAELKSEWRLRGIGPICAEKFGWA